MKYKIQVIRTYTVLDVIDVDEDTLVGANLRAVEISDNKDYTGQLKLDEIETTVIESNATTTIPQEEWGVHIAHCCSEHGCKYADKDCPVVLGLATQIYKCMDCK